MIRETLVVTRRADGAAHVAPMGVQPLTLPDGVEVVLLQPFRPSATLENLQRWPYATLNHVDRRALTGRQQQCPGNEGAQGAGTGQRRGDGAVHGLAPCRMAGSITGSNTGGYRGAT